MQNTKTDRIYWSCRRGMLELDLILIPFYQHKYSHLSKEQQQQFIDLLAFPDMDLYAWLTGQCDPDDAAFQPITTMIRHYAQDPTRPRGL